MVCLLYDCISTAGFQSAISWLLALCFRCVQCHTCGANDPGPNCHWLKGFTECGPCSSRTLCPVCQDGYGDGELIINCVRCERWLHCLCDRIRTEADAEKCADAGYNCILCRPSHVPPPHLVQSPVMLKPKPKPLPLPAPIRMPSPPRSPGERQCNLWLMFRLKMIFDF